jgi:hypothetical protein
MKEGNTGLRKGILGSRCRELQLWKMGSWRRQSSHGRSGSFWGRVETTIEALNRKLSMKWQGDEKVAHWGWGTREGCQWMVPGSMAPGPGCQGQLIVTSKVCALLVFSACHCQPSTYYDEEKRCGSWPQQAHFLVHGGPIRNNFRARG